MEEKIKALLESEGFIDKMLACEEPEQVQALFAENGIELSLEEVKAIGAGLESALNNEEGELDEDALEEVAGGVAVTAVISVTAALIAGGIKVGAAITRNWRTIRRWFRRW